MGEIRKEVKKFEIDKLSLEKKITKDQLRALKKEIANQALPDKISFEEDDDNLYIIFNKKKFLITNEKLKESIESIYKNLQTLHQEVINKPNLPKTEISWKYVEMHLDTYDIKTLFWLYKQLKENNNLKKVIEKELVSRAEKNSFQENKELLEKLKSNLLENTNLYEKVIFTILKKLETQQEGDKLINTVWKENIQKTVKNHIIIDDKFAEDFYFHFHTSDKTRWYTVKCEGSDKVACNAFTAYILAIKDQTKISNLNVLWPTLYKAFDGKLTEFKTWVLESINKYKEIKWKLPDDTIKIIQKDWLLGFVNEKINESLDKTNMTEWQKQWWKWFWEIALWIWTIIWIFKLIQKTWFKWLLKLILWGTVLEFWAQVATWKSFFTDIVPKLLNGWLTSSEIEKTTQNWIDIAKYNEDYAEQMSKLSFLNMIFWNKKISDLKDFIKIENWKITKFYTKKYIDYLKNKNPNDWRIQIINWMWDKVFSSLVVSWFSDIWIKSKTDLNKTDTINTIFADYQKKVKKEQQKKSVKPVARVETGGTVETLKTNNKKEKQQSKQLQQTNWIVKQKKSVNTVVWAGTSRIVWKLKTNNEKGKQTLAKTIESVKINKQEVAKYFNTDWKELNKLDKKLKEYNLNLDIYDFLNSYKQYIQTNLKGLDETYLNKVKKSILLKTLQLSSIIKKRIGFVEKQIWEWNYKKADKSKEIRNQRWIINQKMQDYFSFVNSELLPSVAMLLRYW